MSKKKLCPYNERFVILTLTWPIEKAIDASIAHALGSFIVSVSHGYERAYLKSCSPALAMYDIASTKDSGIPGNSPNHTMINEIALWIPAWRKKAVQRLLESLTETFTADYEWSEKEGVSFTSSVLFLESINAKPTPPTDLNDPNDSYTKE